MRPVCQAQRSGRPTGVVRSRCHARRACKAILQSVLQLRPGELQERHRLAQNSGIVVSDATAAAAAR